VRPLLSDGDFVVVILKASERVPVKEDEAIFISIYPRTASHLMFLGNQMKENEITEICFKNWNTQKCIEDTWTYFDDKAWITE
jgi:hypothetical protein